MPWGRLAIILGSVWTFNPATGEFEIGPVYPGSYRLVIRAPGFVDPPAIRRDLSAIVDEPITWEAIAGAVNAVMGLAMASEDERRD